MKTLFSVRLTSLFLALLLTAQPAVYAQKLSRKALRALRAQEASEFKKMADLAAEASSTNAAFRSLQNEILSGPRAQRWAKGSANPRSKKARKQFFETFHAEITEESLLGAAGSSKKRKFSKRLPFQPYAKVSQIVQNEKNPLKALTAIQKLEDFFPGHSFFSLFAFAYYNQYFSIVTPHLKELFKKVEFLHDRGLEARFAKRMRFLAENRDNFRRVFAPNIPKQGMRIRYTKDISRLTAQNFHARNLIFSFERKLNPGQETAAIRHISARSMLPVGKKQAFPIYQYNGPFEYLPLLYRYLLNGDHPKKKLTIFLDRQAKAMAIYNEDNTLWLRITPHEYSFPERLHLHLNEIRTAEITTALGLVQEETVNFNLSIPLAAPPSLPSYNRSEFLYNEMIIKPIKHLRSSQHVTVIERTIF